MKPKLEYFSHGTFVVELQTKLNLLMPGAQPPLKVDGVYGAGTVARVKQFQKSRGLFPDGVVGAKTWAAVDGTSLGVGGPSVPGGASPNTAPTSPRPPGKKVYTGSPIRCSYGYGPATLMVGHPGPATTTDSMAYVNIGFFGTCGSKKNPKYVPPYTDRFMPDVSLSMPTPCMPVILGPWHGHAPVPSSAEDEPLGFGFGEVIDSNACCNCAWGGVIRFT